MPLFTREHWIVASVSRGPERSPSMHTSQRSAEDEAARLARTHRDDTFVIYHAVAITKAVDIHTTYFEPQEPPF